MSIILAIDTSTERASVALLTTTSSFGRTVEGVAQHSTSILPMISALLAEAEISLSQVDAIAFAAGPGSFTGLRTACGVAQGLAYGAGLPVIQIGTLLAMAETCRIRYGATEVLSVLDARMNEVYWAQYAWRENRWHVISEPALSAPASVIEGNYVACGNGVSLLSSTFAANHADIMPEAMSVATLAQQSFKRGETMHPALAQPVYVRNQVAQTIEERIAAKAGL